MKNTNNITTYTAATLSAIGSTAAARKAADDAYKAAKTEMVGELARFLKENPEAIVLNKDLARQCGIEPGHMASIVQSEGYRLGIQSDSMTVTKRYAEVDESGQLVEGGTVREENRSLTVFKARRERKPRW